MGKSSFFIQSNHGKITGQGWQVRDLRSRGRLRRPGARVDLKMEDFEWENHRNSCEDLGKALSMGISMGSKGTISRENMGKAGKIHENQFFEWICQWEKQQSVAGIRTQPACVEVPNFLEGLGTTVKQGRSRVRKIFT